MFFRLLAENKVQTGNLTSTEEFLVVIVALGFPVFLGLCCFVSHYITYQEDNTNLLSGDVARSDLSSDLL